MSRPNLLVILCDQERFDLLGCNGSTLCRTPSLDRLAAEGMRCTHAFTPIGICTPARASLMTGRYPHRHGLLNNCHSADAVRQELPEGEVTFSQLLRDAGYRLGYVGKWHVGKRKGPRDWGFHDEARPYPGAPTGVDGPLYTDGLTDAIYARFRHDRMLVAGTEPCTPAETLSRHLADETIRLLTEYAEGVKAGQPFCLRLDFPGPHHPYVVPEPYASMYDPATIPPWPNFAESFAGKPGIQRKFLRLRGVEGFTWEDWSRIIAKYLGFMTLIDAEIGRVLAALERLGLSQETLVIHTADHGDMIGSHRQFNKGPAMYEEVYHIPFLARWPGRIAPGSTNEQFVSLVDLMPTFTELAGVLPPAEVDGRSLLPLLRGEVPEGWPEEAFAEYHGEEWGLYSQRMVRNRRYKYVYNTPEFDELYDLELDPAELVNRIDDPAYQEVRLQMERRLIAWMRKTGDGWVRWASKELG